MSPHAETLQTRIGEAERLVRRRAGLALAIAALAALPAALLLAWSLGLRWIRPTPLPLLIDGFLLGVAAAAWLYWRRVLRPRLGTVRVADAAERRLGLQAGSLRGVLELHDNVPAGTSPALARRAEQVLALRIAGEGTDRIAGDLGERWARRARRGGAALGVAALAIVALAFASPERTRAGWAPLLDPVGQLRPPELPALVVEPGDAEVQRGEPLAVRVRAVGREAVVLHWRLEGDVAREQLLPVTGDQAGGAIPEVTAAGEYWIEAPDGARSSAYRVTPIDALLLSELVVDVLYPEYLGLPTDHYEGELPPLEIPAGTTLRIQGRATRPLVSAALQGAQGTLPFTVDERAFSGRWTPAQSGLFAWQLRDESGSGLAIAAPPIEILLAADQAPTVDVTFPGTDTLFEPDLRQALAAAARDDHGLVAAVVVSWRVSSTGEREAPVETPLVIERAADHAVLRTVLDASARGLAAGDTLKYFVRVTDNAPARQTGVSATYTLRIPTAEELRSRAERDASAALEQAESLQERVSELQRETRNAERNAQASNARRANRASGQGGAPGSEGAQRMQFEESREARRLLENQQAMLQQVEQLKGAMQSLEKSMTEAGLRDQELQRKLEELRELYDRLLTPELRRQMEQLQQAVQQLSPEAMEKALERLAEEQKRMQEELDRSVELLKRAAAEQELSALAQQAKELSTQQEALSKAHEESAGEQSQRRQELQEELAAQTEKLASAMEKLGRELGQQGEQQAAERTAGAAEQAGEAKAGMEQAAESAAQQQGRKAAEQGREAAAQLREAAESLDGARRDMAESGRQEAEDSMQQATRDALALAQRQQELQQQMEKSQQEQQGGQSKPSPPQQPGSQGQKGGQQQQGQKQSQQGGQEQGGQSAQQGGGERQGGRQQGGQQGGEQQGGTAGQPGSSDLAQMRAQQSALQQGLEQLGKNLSETGRESGAVTQDVGAALNRANTAMQQTQRGLEQAQQTGQLPTEQAGQSVEALNRLALSLLNNAQQLQQAQGGSGTQQALDQLADLAQQQGSVNGQASSLQPLGLPQSAVTDQARRLGQEQAQIAQQLEGMSNMLGGREDVLGQIDALAKEAEALARELDGGRLPPGVRARQERLFHRLLDAGRTLEQEETSDERTAERPGTAEPRQPGALDPRLFDNGARYRVPTAEELRSLPPAYRRLILDYFERLNRPAPPTGR